MKNSSDASLAYVSHFNVVAFSSLSNCLIYHHQKRRLLNIPLFIVNYGHGHAAVRLISNCCQTAIASLFVGATRGPPTMQAITYQTFGFHMSAETMVVELLVKTVASIVAHSHVKLRPAVSCQTWPLVNCMGLPFTIYERILLRWTHC